MKGVPGEIYNEKVYGDMIFVDNFSMLIFKYILKQHGAV